MGRGANTVLEVRHLRDLSERAVLVRGNDLLRGVFGTRVEESDSRFVETECGLEVARREAGVTEKVAERVVHDVTNLLMNGKFIYTPPPAR